MLSSYPSLRRFNGNLVEQSAHIHRMKSLADEIGLKAQTRGIGRLLEKLEDLVISVKKRTEP